MAEKDEDICAELARDKETVKLWVLNYASRKKEYYENIKYIRDQLPGPAGLKRPAGSGSAVQADTNNQIEGDFDKKGLYGAVLLL